MGGGRPRASTSGRAAARTLRSASTPPSFPRPLPSLLHRQEPTAPLPPSPRPLPSFLRRQEPTAPLPSFPRPLPVIPAQAGTRATSTVAPHPQFIPPTPHPPHPLPNSSLPPSRGEVRWGVGGREPPPAAEPPPAPSGAHPRLRHPCTPLPSFLRRQEPTACLPSFLRPLRHSCAGRNPRYLHRRPPSPIHPTNPSPTHPHPQFIPPTPHPLTLIPNSSH